MAKRLRIVTRKSELALWQAEYVRGCLLSLHSGLSVEILPMTSSGDRIQDRPLSQVGGKGLFIKELENALLGGDVDLAVHSMKDVPATLVDTFELPVVLEAGDPCDAFVSNAWESFDALPQGARLGTASLRRQMQARHRRPDLTVSSLRGNVHTRLRKLDEGQFDAIILAGAGLRRLGLEGRIRQSLPTDVSLPAIGQGALGVEIRRGDSDTLALVRTLDHLPTHSRLAAERGLNARLGGSCSIPLAGYAELRDEQLYLTAALGTPDGTRMLTERRHGPVDQARALGVETAERLLARGAGDILASLDLGWRDPGRA